MDQVITEVLHIMVIFLQLFRKIMNLDDMIMTFRQRVLPQSIKESLKTVAKEK